MGLFSSKKVVSVASSAYNMAGGPEDRSNYLQTTAIRSILTGNDFSQSVRVGQAQGPHAAQKTFFRWAQTSYDVGQLTSNISGTARIGPAEMGVIGTAVEAAIGGPVNVYEAAIERNDISPWAEQWVLNNYRERFETNWVAEYSGGVAGIVTITWEDATTSTFTATGFDPYADFLVAVYVLNNPLEVDDWVIGEVTDGLTTEPDPVGETPPWNLVTNTPQMVPVTRQRNILTETRDDGETEWTEESSIDSTFNDSFNTRYKKYEREVLISQGPEYNVYENQEYHWNRYYELVEEVTVEETYDELAEKTTRVTTTEDIIYTRYSVRIDTQEFRQENILGTQNVYIYRIGSGNSSLDALQDSGTISDFFPIIPLRIENKFITHPDYDAEYSAVVKAYKRATGGSIQVVLSSIGENPDIDDVDHAFLVPGIEINAENNAEKEYMYHFFKTLQAQLGDGDAELQEWIQNQADYEQYLEDYAEWEQNSDEGPYTPPPSWVAKPIPAEKVISLEGATSPFRVPYQVQIKFRAAVETVSAGYGRVGAKKGDCWWETRPNLSTASGSGIGTLVSDITVTCHRLYWQSGDYEFRYLDLYGLVHLNKIYDGKAVTTTPDFDNTDDSNFVIPLHKGSLDAMSIRSANEFAQSCRVLVFNSYEVTKVKWWQRGIFKIILFVAAIVVTAMFAPAGAGLLGAHAAVGGALGFGGFAAVVAGAAINALAAVVLTSAITWGAQKLFGDEIGLIIAVIASFVVFNTVTTFQATGSFGVDFNSFFQIDNLIRLTSSLSGAYQQIIQRKIVGIQGEMEELDEKWDETKEMFEDLWEQLGGSEVTLDPLMWSQMTSADLIGLESMEGPEMFLTRTLMTGTDLINLTQMAVSDFVSLSNSLPGPYD